MATLNPSGTYLTDGKKLLCIESTMENSSSETVFEVEDCVTFELSIWTGRSLARMGFREVRPQETAGTEGGPGDGERPPRSASIVQGRV
jgi:hypothetical protein